MTQRVLVVESVGTPDVNLIPEELQNSFFTTLLERIAELKKNS